MICLDTNYLIRGLIPKTPEAEKILGWLEAGEPIGIPSVAWYEFLCGPVQEEEIQLAIAILTAGILALGAPQAAEAARLFNATARSRRLRVDAMIAGTATAANADLATLNRDDFEPFVAHGLTLV